jgi:hypothetical protein
MLREKVLIPNRSYDSIALEIGKTPFYMCRDGVGVQVKSDYRSSQSRIEVKVVIVADGSLLIVIIKGVDDMSKGKPYR